MMTGRTSQAKGLSVVPLDDQETDKLGSLIFNWGGAYVVIWHDDRSEYTATRTGAPSPGTLTDTTIEGLTGQIRLDYLKWGAFERMST
jgi:hypothetical protein